MTNKISVLIVCEKSLVRSLLMMELNKSEDLNIVGSCKNDSTLYRFLNIYHPQVVLIYSFSKIKFNDYNTVHYLRKNTSAKIVVLSPNALDYEVGMFLRYGAHSVTDDGKTIVQFIKDTNLQLAKTQFASAYLRYLPQYKKLKIRRHTRGIIESLVGHNSGYVYYWATDTLVLNNKMATMLMAKRKAGLQKYIRELKKNRELPENNEDLVDYARLYPEHFLPVKLKKNDGKKRFTIFFSNELCKRIEQLRGFKRKKIDYRDVRYGNYVFDKETTDTLFKWRPYDKK